MLKAETPKQAITTMNASDRLHGLIDRIAAGDRVAFQRLYTLLAVPVWRDAARTLPHPRDVKAVTRSTFLEVWHMAKHHAGKAGTESRTWITAITARRARDRRRAYDTTTLLRDDHDGHTLRELTTLLGRRPHHDRVSSRAR
jgi:DNA-directed RNA polymerase specialized sigma24 family protein